MLFLINFNKTSAYDEKLFGTDGIRGVANQYPMTSEVALSLGRALAHVFTSHSFQTRLGAKWPKTSYFDR